MNTDIKIFPFGNFQLMSVNALLEPFQSVEPSFWRCHFLSEVVDMAYQILQVFPGQAPEIENN